MHIVKHEYAWTTSYVKQARVDRERNKLGPYNGSGKGIGSPGQEIRALARCSKNKNWVQLGPFNKFKL
jgi:hypothetical protein